MSRKTTGTTGTTRRRVAVGTALLSITAIIGSGLASATASTPTVSSASVYDGTDAGGALVGPLKGLNSVVTLKGTHLDDVRNVFFGDTAATKLVVESATLAYVTPPAHAAGTVHLKLGTSGQTATDATDISKDYVYTAGPVVSSVAVADKLLTVTGEQLDGATAVLVGDTLVKVDTKKSPATSTKVSVKVPSVKGGSLDVSVISPMGVGTKAGAYGVAPVISKILPDLSKGAKAITSASSATGTVATVNASATSTVSTYGSDTGTVVLLTGSGFSGLKSITFGKATADAVVISDTVARVRIPAKSADDAWDSKSPTIAKVDVVAENGFGKSKAVKFTYNNAPQVTAADDVVGLSTSSTNTVTFTGKALNGAKVTFSGKAGKVTASSDTSVTVTAPKPTGTGDVDVKFTTAAGYFTLVKGYTYAATDSKKAWPTVG